MGHKFTKMEQNPLHSQDLNHGVPNLYNEILNYLLEGPGHNEAELMEYPEQ